MLRAESVLHRSIAQVIKQQQSPIYYSSAFKVYNGKTQCNLRHQNISNKSSVKVTETVIGEIEKDRLKNASASVQSVESEYSYFCFDSVY